MPTTPTFAALVGDAFARDPPLLDRALQCAARWRALGAVPAVWLDRWEALLRAAQRDAEGMAALQDVLRSNRPDAQRLREFAPLAGVLPREIRRQAGDLCGFRH